MSGIDETRLRRAFLEEADELSQKLGLSLMSLESNRADSRLVNEVFRLTHSLKSESALMGFTTLSELAHRMEDVLGLARDGSLALEKPVMDSLFAGADLIAEMMAAIGKGGSDADFATADVLRGLSTAGGNGPENGHAAPLPGGTDVQPAEPSLRGPGAGPVPGAPPPVGLGSFEKLQLAEARDRGEALLRLTVSVDEGEPMKFPRAYLVFSNLEAVSNVVKVLPPMEGQTAEDSLYARTTVLLTSGSEEEVRKAASGVDQIAEVRIERCGFDAFLSDAAADVSLTTGRERGPAGFSAAGILETGAVTAGLDEQSRRGEPAQDARRAGPVEKASIRVDTRKLDDLWSLIAELVLHKSHIARLSEEIVRGKDVHTVREELVESFDSLDKISSGMQQAMMDTRMIPISVIFNKFPRLVRDLSRKLGKPVDLALFGEDTEIDRSIVEALSDPLTHIIRNSLDHGIEFPEERVRSGKNEKGRVSVSARRQGGNIVIELEDDGRGIDAESIRRKARGMGISGAENFTETQLLDLIFLPGFSTKEVVTDLSGRGVGMDVVATRIRGDLKGDVVLQTEPNRGTRVTLFLPLTLTIVNALLVRGDAQLYALPLTDVDSTAKVVSTEIRGEESRESALWMEEEIPVFSLGALFGGGRRRADEYFAAVLRHGDRRAYLLVDELIEEREVVIKPVDDLLNSRKMFSGVSVLENGKLVFILDTSFIRREQF
ncbi:MAG: ATP-binding protein [Spirochaetia bacterium]